MKHKRNGGTNREVVVGAVILAVVIIALVASQQTGGQQPDDAPPLTLSATRVPMPITLGEYIVRHRRVTGRPFVSNRVAGQSGQLVTYAIANLAPEANERCEMRWTQHDRDRQRPAEESFWRYEQVLGWPDGLLRRSNASATATTGELWVPLPNPFVDIGWFQIRLHLLCDGREMAYFDTDAFRVEPPTQAARFAGTPIP